MNRQELWIAVAVLIAVLTLDTLPAIIIGVVVSLGLLIYHVSFPSASELGRDRVTGVFESRGAHEEAAPIPGLVVYRFDAPLMYANAGFFANAARDLIDAADPPARVLVIDCEEMIGIDFTGVEEFEGLVEDMHERGVEVRLARVQRTTLERLRARGVIETLGDDKIFRRVEDAVSGRA